MSYDKTGFIDLGPINEHIPVNNGVMPVNYGYIENIINKEEKDNVDVIVFSSNAYKTGDVVEVEVFGILMRKDGDHKVIASDDSIKIENFNDVESEERDLILKYFGYKSEITSVNSKEEAIEYLKGCIC